MGYSIIYEFAPNSNQFYMLLIPIATIIVGIIGLKSARKQGFVRLPLMPPNPFTKEYMDKFAEFFAFLFILFGVIGLIVSIVIISEQLTFEKELNYSQIKNPIEVTAPNSILFYEKIRLRENILINGEEFVFARTETSKEANSSTDIQYMELGEPELFRISYAKLDKKNIILKIEKMNY